MFNVCYKTIKNWQIIFYGCSFLQALAQGSRIMPVDFKRKISNQCLAELILGPVNFMLGLDLMRENISFLAINHY